MDFWIDGLWRSSMFVVAQVCNLLYRRFAIGVAQYLHLHKEIGDVGKSYKAPSATLLQAFEKIVRFAFFA